MNRKTDLLNCSEEDRYVAPAIEIVCVAVEQGIATSGTEGFGEDGEGDW